MHIYFKCAECENHSCGICPLGTYVPEGSAAGCIRKATDEEMTRYLHLTEEAVDNVQFSLSAAYRDSVYADTMDLLESLYGNEMTSKVDRNGNLS